MNYYFGRESSERLATVHHVLQSICRRALSYGVMDFSVTEGYRTAQMQQALYRQGRTTIDGINVQSKHNQAPSLAVDLLPFPPVVNGVNVWSDHQRFHVLAGLMFASAAEQGAKLRWGGDWDGDGNNKDSTFHDLPHFELVIITNDGGTNNNELIV